MKIRCIIVDDEELAILRLEKLLRKFPEFDIISKCYDGQEAVTAINKEKPDLVFLDIQMPVYNGFEVIEHLNYQPLIIFTTAYDEYALKAFEANSIDYLLKPIEKDRLQLAVEKIVRLNNSFNKTADSNSPNYLKAASDINKETLNKIKVKSGDEIKFIPYNEIYFFKAEDKYITIKTAKFEYIINGSLINLKNELPEYFKHVHRAYLVNKNYIDKIIRYKDRKYLAVLKNAEESKIPVSRNKKNILLD